MLDITETMGLVFYALETKSNQTKGDAENCSMHHPCNGVTRVPNDGHTACGKLCQSCF